VRGTSILSIWERKCDGNRNFIDMGEKMECSQVISEKAKLKKQPNHVPGVQGKKKLSTAY